MSVEPSALESASPTLTEQAPSKDDLTAWVTSDKGVGPLQLGMPFADAIAALPGAEHMCGETVYAAGDDPNARFWIVQNADGSLSHIEWYLDDGPRTADGLGVGSTRAEVLATHPDAVLEARNLAWLTSGNLLFGFREGTTYRSDGTETGERSDTDRVVAMGVASDGPLYEFCG